jgi:DNA-binding MarR family transcriptional regulator
MRAFVKDPIKIETIVKGFANYRRIQIIYLISYEKGLSVNNIADRLNIGFRSVSQHLDKMYKGGLVSRRHRGVEVIYETTSRGREVTEFIKALESN